MPIRPENRARYPANWRTEIRPAILSRAGNRCEGSPAYPDCRAGNGQPHPITGSKVVLTVAHLDHTPENCEPGNLRAWCQRCHCTYDAPTKAARRQRAQANDQQVDQARDPESVRSSGGSCPAPGGCGVNDARLRATDRDIVGELQC